MSFTCHAAAEQLEDADKRLDRAVAGLGLAIETALLLPDNAVTLHGKGAWKNKKTVSFNIIGSEKLDACRDRVCPVSTGNTILIL
ncbi:MAG: hypothetical protein LBL33_05905 [Tannerella sp.]|nr:hypothetical protein [Tannerella sp.]